MLTLPFEVDWFDVVICESVLAFIEDKPQAIRECVRVVKPGGYVWLNESLWADPNLTLFSNNVILCPQVMTVLVM